jgi:hypothetical protein
MNVDVGLVGCDAVGHVGREQRFGGTHCLHIEGWSPEGSSFSDTLVSTRKSDGVTTHKTNIDIFTVRRTWNLSRWALGYWTYIQVTLTSPSKFFHDYHTTSFEVQNLCSCDSTVKQPVKPRVKGRSINTEVGFGAANRKQLTCLQRIKAIAMRHNQTVYRRRVLQRMEEMPLEYTQP